GRLSARPKVAAQRVRRMPQTSCATRRRPECHDRRSYDSRGKMARSSASSCLPMLDTQASCRLERRFQTLVLPFVVTKGALVTNVYQEAGHRGAMKTPAVVSGGVPGASGPAIYRQKSLNRSGASSV